MKNLIKELEKEVFTCECCREEVVTFEETVRKSIASAREELLTELCEYGRKELENGCSKCHICQKIDEVLGEK